MKFIPALLITAVCASPIAATDDSLPISVESSIVTNAIKALGCDQLDNWQPNDPIPMQMVTIVDSTTPFLPLDGRRAWRVDLKAVPRWELDSVEMGRIPNPSPRDFEVYLDSATGAAIMITSTLPSYYDKVASGEIRIPSREEAEAQLTGEHCMFVYEPLVMSLRDCLNRIWDDPWSADKVVACYVHYYGDGRPDALRAWIVDAYGRAPTPIGGHLPTDQKPKIANHFRALVDANSRRFMSLTTAPQVIKATPETTAVHE